MDIKQLKEHLIDNIGYVEDILNKYFYNVRYYDNSNQWRFGITEYCNPNSIRLSADTLNYKDYKNNLKGDLLALLMRKLNTNLGKVLDIVKNNSDYKDVEYKSKEVYGNFFKRIDKNEISKLNYYDNSLIEEYRKTYSKFFLEDGVTLEAQDRFNIRYDVDTNRIIIPVYLKGKLVGCIGRYNLRDSGDYAKYLPILNYSKNKVIFGYDVNYSNIINKRVYIVESEKTVIKAYGEGYNNLIAIGGNDISQTQKELIYSMKPKEIVVVLDKGLGKARAKELNLNEYNYMEDMILNQCKKLKSDNVFLDMKVGYINCNDIKILEDKDNIFDLEYDESKKFIDKIKFI